VRPLPRRAKRLKKLNRMMTSSAAQSSTLRFKQQTWLCFGVILVAHVVGYAILSTQIQKRFEWVQEPGAVEEKGERGHDEWGLSVDGGAVACLARSESGTAGAPLVTCP
jgi:hypothetical protein